MNKTTTERKIPIQDTPNGDHNRVINNQYSNYTKPLITHLIITFSHVIKLLAKDINKMSGLKQYNNNNNI